MPDPCWNFRNSQLTLVLCIKLWKGLGLLLCIYILTFDTCAYVLVNGEECSVSLPTTIRSPIFDLTKRPTEKFHPKVENKGTDTSTDFDFEAISYLHQMLDDDHNGEVDQFESDEFLRDELQYADGSERQKTLHGSDQLLTIDDLWERWKHSEVYNWTLEDTIEWLVVHVELPQYTQNFQLMSISGPSIPRIAANKYHYLSGVLGVKNPVHKHKLSLKAMDAVLFGPPKKSHNYLKDLALVISLVIAVGGCWFAFIQHRSSTARMKKMMQDLDQLQKAEDALKELQEKLDQSQISPSLSSREFYGGPFGGYDDDTMSRDSDHDSCSLVDAAEKLRYYERQLAEVSEALIKARAELDFTRRSANSPSVELQVWLQITYNIEFEHFKVKRQAAEKQLILAKDAWEKIQKRRTAFMGTLRMAHSNSIESVDERINSAKSALEEVQSDLSERNQRWRQIEKICGFPVIINPGLAALKQSLSGEKYRTKTAANRVSLDLELEGDEDSLPFCSTKPSPNVLKSMLTSQNDPRIQQVKSETGSQGSLSKLNGTFSTTSYTSASAAQHPRSGSFGSLNKVSINHKKQNLPKRLFDHRNSAHAVNPISFDLGDTFSTSTNDSDFSSLEHDTCDISNVKMRNRALLQPVGMVKSHSQIHPTSLERHAASIPRNYSDLHNKLENGIVCYELTTENNGDDESVVSEDSFVSLDSKSESPKKKRKTFMISKIKDHFRKQKVH